MTKVTGPLFGSEAHGRINGIGSFRRGRHGPEFIQQAKGTGGNTPAQQQLRACFATAKTAHSEADPFTRLPWPDFWRQWLIDHPECLA